MEYVYFYSPNLDFRKLIEIFSAGCLLHSEVHLSQEKQILAGLRENYMLNSGVFSLQRPIVTRQD